MLTWGSIGSTLSNHLHSLPQPKLLLAYQDAAAQAPQGFDQQIDALFKPFADIVSSTVFFSVGKVGKMDIPAVLLILVGSAAFFTLFFRFVNVRHYWTAINVVRGKYDEIDGGHQAADPELAVDGDIPDTIRDESQEGEVTHFQALATAVSGTVGNGNIAGVALAIGLGGPGATFWMIVCGLMGMSTKFVECTLGVRYRDVDKEGVVHGGPMYYISKGLKDRGFGTLGTIAAMAFSVFCVGGSFGGGNAAQSNQAAVVIRDYLGLTSPSAGFWVGMVLAAFVGIIIIGGIRRIASVTEKIVPLMAVLYVLACLYILGSNLDAVGTAVSLILEEAFSPRAGLGGVIGVIFVGFRRAAFSNEAGAGSASIAHSAVKTRYAASEGLVALLEPFIDTVVICTMTALVIIVYNINGVFAYGGEGGSVIIDGQAYQGAGITQMAFAKFIPYSDLFLMVAVVLFAVSTMISWSYYGLQAWKFLFGKSKAADLTYKLLFLAFVVIGAAANMKSVWDFSDAMIFAMVFPNMLGLYFLFPEVRRELARYLEDIREKLKSS